jgi:ABC-type phosphate transport system substrate-binding protein
MSAVAGLLATTPATFGYADQSAPIAIVVSKASPIDELTIHDLKHLFMGEFVTGPGGKKLIPLAPTASSPERTTFDKSVLGMSTDQEASYWIDRKIRGQSGAPKSLDSADMLQRVVSKLDGAVGYVRIDQVSGDVKVLRIDGKKPGDGGYRVAD